jgi:hypothetical protein
MSSFNLRVLVLKEGELWRAVSIDHYLTTYSDSPESVLRKLYTMITNYISACKEEGCEPFASLVSAPNEYQLLFGRAHLCVGLLGEDDLVLSWSEVAATADIRLAA